jgi:hypothetical protein
MHFDAISSNPKSTDRTESFDELIGAVTGQTAFTIVSNAINPGNSTTFPWLSKIAVLFERYQFEQLEFYFQHDVSQYASQGQTGLVLLSCLFDAGSSSPTSKTQIEASFPHVICMPNQNSLLRIPVSKLHPKGYPLYVRPGQLPGGSDIKTFDAGNLFVTVQGMVGAGEVGELHVRGRVKLIDRILDSSLTAVAPNNQFVVFNSTAGESLTTATGKTLLYAGTQVGSIGVVNSAGTLQLPAGNYLVDVDTIFSFTGLATQAESLLAVNGAGIFPVANAYTFTSGSLTGVSVHQSSYVQSTGTAATGALSNMALADFTTGACTVYSSLRIQAV